MTQDLTTDADPQASSQTGGDDDSVVITGESGGVVDVRRKRPPALSFLLRLDTARRVARVLTLVMVDLAALFLAILTALLVKAAIRTGGFAWTESVSEARGYLAFAFLVTALLFARSKLYAERAQRPGVSALVSALFAGTVVTLIFALVTGEEYSSYFIFYGTAIFALFYIGWARWIYERVTGHLLTQAGYRRRTIVLGSGDHVDDVAAALVDAVHAPVEVVGIVSATQRDRDGFRWLGSVSDLAQILSTHAVDEVVIADSSLPDDLAVSVMDHCHPRGVTVRVAPTTTEILIHRAEFVPGAALPLFELRPPVLEGFDYLIKRGFDFLVTTLLLVVLAPFLGLIALAIKLTSRGPVLYRSLRPGIGGIPFACLKFRTMHHDADQHQVDLESLNEASGALFKIRDDPRLTSIGRFLRRYSLDELPQLLNVMFGHMSLIGPRPLPQRDYDILEDWHKKRYLVLPGLTGLWQVSGRSELNFDELVRLDFLYLERWSIGLDLGILFKTVPAILSKRGAY